MKITCAGAIYGMRTLKDRGIKFQVETPEMSPADVATLYQLNGRQGWFIFSESRLSKDDIPEKEARKLKGNKTQSQLLRAVLYRTWEAEPEGFENFDGAGGYYEVKMGEIIYDAKKKLAEFTE